MQDQIITKQSACLLESSVLHVCHVSLVGVLMSPYEIRADLSFSLSGSLSNWNGFMLCLVKERERESVGQLSTAYTAFLLIKTLPVPPPKIFTYPCTQPPTPCTPLGELLGVCMCMRDDFSSRSLGCVFFFCEGAELIIKIDLHIKKVWGKNMFCSLLLHQHIHFTLQL